jgi:uncharacterized protein
VTHGRPDLDAAINYAYGRLATELATDLSYHDVAHTRDWVVPAALRLAEASGIGGLDLDLVLTAAWFHDIGYVERYVANEPIGARVAGEALPMFGYRPEHVRSVQGMILSTAVPQQPEGILEQLVADADLDILARSEMLDQNHRLRDELSRFATPSTDEEWYAGQLHFFDAHHYFTVTAKRMNDATKAQNRAILAKLYQAAKLA